MQLSWPMKLRIAAAVAVGISLIGLCAWPLAAPSEPSAAVFAGTISFTDAIVLAGLALFAGLTAYFLSWPYGREIGILAVPAGLAVWAVRCGSTADLMRLNPTVSQRTQLFTTLKWEPVFWLAIVTAGFLGVILGQMISSPKIEDDKPQEKSGNKLSALFTAIIAVVASVLITQFCIGILAQDISIPDSKLGSVIAQPAVGQIVFAVLVSFAIAAFVVKKLLNAGYIWPIIASVFLTLFVSRLYTTQQTLQHLVENWPTIFFSNVTVSILPVQIVAFGTLGSIAGYWMAIRYDYWRKHEM